MRGAAAVIGALLFARPVLAEPWVASGGGNIAAARFEAPDDSYPHRIMGQIQERRVLAVRDASGVEIRHDLRQGPEPSHVFEDMAPRLVDADGDGQTDVVVVESSPTQGAQLAIYTLRRGQLVKSAATPQIGTRFRWLGVWSWAPGGLTQIASLTGVTNHRIGDEVIWGGVRDCGPGPEIIVADAGFREVVAVAFDGADLTARPLGITANPEGFAQALTCG